MAKWEHFGNRNVFRQDLVGLWPRWPVTAVCRPPCPTVLEFLKQPFENCLIPSPIQSTSGMPVLEASLSTGLGSLLLILGIYVSAGAEEWSLVPALSVSLPVTSALPLASLLYGFCSCCKQARPMVHAHIQHGLW